MSFKKHEVERLFLRKLGCDSQEGRRHTKYILRVGGRMPLLPLTVERGPGELSARNFNGLKDDLALSRRGLEEAIRCPLGRDCVLLCLVAGFVGRVIRQHEDDKICYPESTLIDAAESIRLVLGTVAEGDPAGAWTRAELDELDRARPNVATAARYPLLKPVADGWLRRARFDGP